MGAEPGDVVGLQFNWTEAFPVAKGVKEASPAFVAGLFPGDGLVAMDGHSLIGASQQQLLAMLKERPLQCQITIWRGLRTQARRPHGLSESLEGLDALGDGQHSAKVACEDSRAIAFFSCAC